MRDLVYVAYHPMDRRLAVRLHKHLYLYRRAGLRVFDRHGLLGGEVVPGRVQEALTQTHVAVLLLSADLLADEQFHEQELPQLCAAVQRKEIVLLLVVARPVDYTGVEELVEGQLALGSSQTLADPQRAEAHLVRLAQRIGMLRGVQRVALDLPILPVSWLQPPLLYGVLAVLALLLLPALLMLGHEALVCAALLVGLPARELTFPLGASLRQGLEALPVLLHAAGPGVLGGVGQERLLALVPVGALALGWGSGWPRLGGGRWQAPVLLALALALLPGAWELTNVLRPHHAILLEGGGGNCISSPQVAAVCSWLYNGGETNAARQEALAGLWTISTACVASLFRIGQRAVGARPGVQGAMAVGLAALLIWLIGLAPWAVALAQFRNDFPRVQSLAAGCEEKLPTGCAAWHVRGAEEVVLVLKQERCPGIQRYLKLPAACMPITGQNSRLLQGD